jgi:hypothetical protein
MVSFYILWWCGLFGATYFNCYCLIVCLVWFGWVRCFFSLLVSINFDWLYFSLYCFLLIAFFSIDSYYIVFLPISFLLIGCISPYWFFWLHALLPIGFFHLIASIYWLILMFGFVRLVISWDGLFSGLICNKRKA